MTEIEELKLVVRHLAGRILGEEITFAAIAEQEAAEQGVAYMPPPAVDANQISAIDARVNEIVAGAIAASAFDPAPIQAAIGDLAGRIDAIELRPAERVDISPVLDGLANLAERVAALEQPVPPLDLDTRAVSVPKDLLDRIDKLEAQQKDMLLLCETTVDLKDALRLVGEMADEMMRERQLKKSA
jgi:hypothetical protein